MCHRFPHTYLTFPTSLGTEKILRDRNSQHRLVSDQLGCCVPSTSGCCCIPQMLLPEASMKYRNSLSTDKESILKSARLENRSHSTRRQREAKRGEGRMEGRKRGYSVAWRLSLGSKIESRAQTLSFSPGWWCPENLEYTWTLCCFPVCRLSQHLPQLIFNPCLFLSCLLPHTNHANISHAPSQVNMDACRMKQVNPCLT